MSKLDWKHMGEDAWESRPDHYFALEGRTLSACMAEVRKLLNGQYTNIMGIAFVDQDKLRDIGRRLQALLDKAEGL
jgi:hypothetical protein